MICGKNGLIGVIGAARISVMVASLEEIDSIPADLVYQSVLLRDPPRPATGEEELQRFRLADAGERIPHYHFHKVQNAKGHFPVALHPMFQIVTKLRVVGTATLYEVQSVDGTVHQVMANSPEAARAMALNR